MDQISQSSGTSIAAINPADSLWSTALAFVDACPWRGARSLARKMREGYFTGWQCVILAMVDGEPAGFCTLAAEDGLVDDDRTPFIGYVYVGERFRGRRLSERMIRVAEDRARVAGFTCMYIRSGEEGLYEKFGYEPCGVGRDRHGEVETVFSREL